MTLQRHKHWHHRRFRPFSTVGRSSPSFGVALQGGAIGLDAQMVGNRTGERRIRAAGDDAKTSGGSPVGLPGIGTVVGGDGPRSGDEPVAGEFGDLLQRPRFGERVGRTGTTATAVSHAIAACARRFSSSTTWLSATTISSVVACTAPSARPATQHRPGAGPEVTDPQTSDMFPSRVSQEL